MSDNKQSTFSKPTQQVVRNKVIDSNDTEMDNPVEDVSAGTKLAAAIEVAPAHTMTNDALDHEKFMAEDVEVIFSEPPDDSDPQFFEATVNGDYVCIPRNGEPFKMKRYHLEVAARSKTGRLRQKKITHADGSMGFEDQMVLATTYPFQVIGDSRKGSEWLKLMLRRPG